MAKNFTDNSHALKAGMLIGQLMNAGVMALPDVDEDGDYTDTITVRLDVGEPYPIEVRVKVLP